ncbi:MAG: cell division protein FtsZ, partial [Sphingomonas sp.]|nr:cell division protein FtsZ [Sphingomonas sp.]
LDGVSMQGAKGVIISITGGEDMRLLEVDEAANHIRELVDPEANIIWGSAFNPELEGKIRVSVVATGIEAEARTEAPAAEPARAFTFSAPRRSEPAAPAAAPKEEAAPAEPAAAETPAPEAKPAPAEAAAPPAEPADDELLLGAETIVPEPAPAATPPAAAEQPKVFDDEAPAQAPRRRWLSSGADAEEEAAPAPRVKLGGTLFERMQNASRGAQRPEDGEGKDSLDIPRFLHRQNNQ